MSTPLYKKIEQDIFEKIQSGEYAENTTIPTEMELSEQYGVSRPTVRQAIQSLVNDGYLERNKKRGTQVIQTKIPQEFTRYVEGFGSEFYSKGLAPKTKVLNFTKTTATKEVAENLEIKEGDPVFKLLRLRIPDDKPAVFIMSFIPCALVPKLESIDFTDHSLYATFREMGQPIESVTWRLEIEQADTTTSVLLDVAENDPLFNLNTRGFTKNRTPIEYSISKYRGDTSYFIFEVTNPKTN